MRPRLLVVGLVGLAFSAGPAGVASWRAHSRDSDVGGRWAGYTEAQARTILLANIGATAQLLPKGAAGGVALPTETEIAAANLEQRTYDDQNFWEYASDDRTVCVIVRRDAEADSFVIQLGPCQDA